MTSILCWSGVDEKSCRLLGNAGHYHPYLLGHPKRRVGTWQKSWEHRAKSLEGLGHDLALPEKTDGLVRQPARNRLLGCVISSSSLKEEKEMKAQRFSRIVYRPGRPAEEPLRKPSPSYSLIDEVPAIVLDQTKVTS